MPPLKIGIWNCWIFMSVFLLQMLVMMFADKGVLEKTHVPREARKNTLERHVGIAGNAVWLLALGYSVFLPLRFGTVWFYAGSFVFGLGLAVLAIATVNFMTAPADHLISAGAYSFSRHPMYLATFLICLGSGIAGGSWAFVALCAIMSLCFCYEALIEERLCVERYGDAYREYMERTPRWIGVAKKRRG